MGYTLPNGTLPPPPPGAPALKISSVSTEQSSASPKKVNTVYRCYILNFANPNFKQILVKVKALKSCYLWDKAFSKGSSINLKILSMKSKSIYLFVPYPKTKENTPENYIEWDSTKMPCCVFMSYVEIVRSSGFTPPSL